MRISIEESKEKYYTKLSSRLADPLTSPKTYWSILKITKKFLAYLLFFMKTNSSQTTRKKLDYLTIFLFNQTLLSNNSVLPTDLLQLTSKCLDSIHFSSCNVAKIISHLDPNKVHGHDMLSIRMTKLCGNSICKLLSIISKDCLNKGKFPHEWKKGNFVPVHKKGNKQQTESKKP